MAIFRTLRHLGRDFALRDLEIEAPAAGRPGDGGHARPAPGAGGVTVEAVVVSSPAIPAGASLTVTAQVSGRTVAFIFIETWLVDDASGMALGPLRRQHHLAQETREPGGVVRPVWADVVSVQASVRPVWPLLSMGDAAVLACAAPERYGSADQGVRGTYTVAGSAQVHDARLVFDEAGAVQRLLLRRGGGRPAAWRPAAFQAGDSFVPAIGVLARGPEGTWSEGRCTADAIIVTGQPFRLEPVDPAPGRYLVSVAVQDLDGGTHRAWAEFRVDEP